MRRSSKSAVLPLDRADKGEVKAIRVCERVSKGNALDNAHFIPISRRRTVDRKKNCSRGRGDKVPDTTSEYNDRGRPLWIETSKSFAAPGE